MGYRIVLSKKAAEQINGIVDYLLRKLQSEQAASHFLDEMHELYGHLERNPYVFAECLDTILNQKRYRKALVSNMNYLVIFRVDDETGTIYVLGVFHGLEKYTDQL